MKLKLPHIHFWTKYYRCDISTGNLHLMRRCRCGKKEIKAIGPFGDMKWRDINTPWTNDWEKESYEKGKDYDSFDELIQEAFNK